MQHKRDRNGNIAYPPEANLFFHFSNDAPEKMLVKSYLSMYPNPALQYHVDNSNPHCLLGKMVEEGLVADRHHAFELCCDLYKNSANGGNHFQALKQFIQNLIQP